MRQVVVTGMGIVSSIGNSKGEVLRSLRESISGIKFQPELKALGCRCQVAGQITGLETAEIGKRPLKTMSDAAKYTAVATLEAVRDAELPLDALHSTRAGVVVGTAFGGIGELPALEILLLTRKNPRRHGATGAVRMMNSTAALNLAAWLGVKGRCCSVSSACATGVDNIGFGFELIQRGVLDVCLCGGADRGWIGAMACLDRLSVTPFDFNDQPEKACRPYDVARQGMVAAEGAGIVVLESLEHADRRRIQPYAEVMAYSSANDGSDMFMPNGRGLKQCVEQALKDATARGLTRVDYINSHGAGTKVGDPVEVQVIREVFGTPSPWVSSTKALSGHSIGAAGAHEAIFTLLMLHHGFIAPSVNLEHVAPECEGVRHVQSLMEIACETAMTFNAGLGGANACVIFTKL